MSIRPTTIDGTASGPGLSAPANGTSRPLSCRVCVVFVRPGRPAPAVSGGAQYLGARCLPDESRALCLADPAAHQPVR